MIPPELSELATSLLLLRFVERKRRVGEHAISTDCVSGKMIWFYYYYLMKRVSRSWSRLTNDFIVR
jgi:hypothetical protein